MPIPSTQKSYNQSKNPGWLNDNQIKEIKQKFMFFLLAVWSLSLATWFFQGILHNHMERGERERERGQGEQTDICALLHPVWLQHFRDKNQKNWKHSLNQNKRHPGTSVVTNYPGKYPYARRSLVHRRNSGHWKSQAGCKQKEPLKAFIKVQEGFIQFHPWHLTTKNQSL